MTAPAKHLAAAFVASAALFLSACGGGADASSSPAQTDATTASSTAVSFPVSVLSGPLDGGEEITIPERPEAIVSLSPTATEMLFAVGAGDQVVAVDDQSDYPEGIPSTDLSGYTPNVEAILGYQPDLVVANGDEELAAQLEAVGVTTLQLPAAKNLDEAYSQIERVGAATGHVGDAAAVVSQMQADIAAALEDVPDHVEGMTYYHELDPSGFTVTGETFIGEVYELFGLTSIADAAGTGDAYPQLASEFVVSADPDLVFLADSECCGVSAQSVAQRAGWQDLAAVRNGHVTDLDEDVTSRWGPRVVEFVETVAEVVAAVEPAPAG